MFIFKKNFITDINLFNYFRYTCRVQAEQLAKEQAKEAILTQKRANKIKRDADALAVKEVGTFIFWLKCIYSYYVFRNIHIYRKL
jgi:hypothetical protein